MKLHNLTICDQVRVEDNGKFLLIGVYTNIIIMAQIPGQLNISVWFLLEAEKLGKEKFEVRLRMPDFNVDFLHVQGEVDIQELESWTPIGVGGGILVGQSGTMTVEAKLGDEPWQELRRVHIRKGPMLP